LRGGHPIRDSNDTKYESGGNDGISVALGLAWELVQRLRYRLVRRGEVPLDLLVYWHYNTKEREKEKKSPSS
jgi:hypothetical protein